VFLVVHELVLINTDSNMHSDKIKIIKVQFNDDTSVLGCDAVSLIEQFPQCFQGNKILQISGTMHPVTQPNTPQDLNLQQYCCVCMQHNISTVFQLC
jgi:hypothetical protein